MEVNRDQIRPDAGPREATASRATGLGESDATCPRPTSPTPNIWVLIPALDEEEALPLVLADLPTDVVSGVLVVDNGSRDRTAAVARAGGAQLVSEPRRGYGSACLAGLAVLLAKTPQAGAEDATAPSLAPLDIVVFLDADHSDYPEQLPRLVAPILEGRADLVIGSRILGGASLRALLPQAWFGNRLACLLMRLLHGARFTDLGPFRAIRVAALRRLAMADTGFGWTIEMQLKAHAAGLAIEEVPVSYRPRTGQSKITGTISGTLGAGTKIIGWILAWRVQRWRRGDLWR
ncbi:MAG: glycosyltransferase family 2 protein [Planctomycetota bacterium]|nr:glycosyltransferase family 2 protein [Planctomycetota bacterium]